MSLNSVNTNIGQMVALQSLEATASELATTQKRVSTGYRVADASDDGAAFAIAQGIRSTVGGLTSVNQQLGNVTGLLNTTQAGLTGISKLLSNFRDTLVQLAGDNVTSTDQANYQATLQSDLDGIKNFVASSSYNGKSLIGDVNGDGSTPADLNIAQDASGSAYYTIKAHDMSQLITTLTGFVNDTGQAAQDDLKSSATPPNDGTGTLTDLESFVGTALNDVGSRINYVSTQTTFNNNKIDALNSGLGSLIDADLAKESAQLTALQIRQQLGTQALSMANQAPQTLLSLFK